jgi:pSer/pThr/pTyr-binding forkhead associated (FHA) protein
MWILQSSEPASEDATWTFRMTPGAIKTVGRAPRADFILDAALVSRLHCRLTAGDTTVEVVDLKSTNGTFVNGKRVDRASLSVGDRLRLGRVELKIGRATSDNSAN